MQKALIFMKKKGLYRKSLAARVTVAFGERSISFLSKREIWVIGTSNSVHFHNSEFAYVWQIKIIFANHTNCKLPIIQHIVVLIPEPVVSYQD